MERHRSPPCDSAGTSQRLLERASSGARAASALTLHTSTLLRARGSAARFAGGAPWCSSALVLCSAANGRLARAARCGDTSGRGLGRPSGPVAFSMAARGSLSQCSAVQTRSPVMALSHEGVGACPMRGGLARTVKTALLRILDAGGVWLGLGFICMS